MLRIEILFDRTAKPLPSEPMFSALKNEIGRQLKPQFPDMVTRVALGSNPQLSISGTKVDGDKEKIEQILENIWLDDGWIPE